jgi:LysR family nitrogen assimilation transcriptional regulator
MDLRQFRYFIQAARRQNFRKASDDLRIAQSALTRQIQYLERELGFLLFDRVKRGVRLTAAGQRLLERSQYILEEVDRLKETLLIEAHVPSGPASLAAPPSIGRLVFSKLAHTFLKSYPKVTLSLLEGWTSNVLGQLRRGELSLAIVTDPPPDPLLEYRRLFTESIYLVGRPDDPRLKKRSLEVKSIGDLPLVMTSKANRSRQLIENSAARDGAPLDIRLELESPETLRQLLLSGRIYGLLPYSSIFHDAETRRLGVAPIKGLVMTRYLAKSRTEANSGARETLESVTLAEMRELAKRVGSRTG